MLTKWIRCNVCGDDSYKKISSVGEWTIGRCETCGLIYVNPAPFFDPGSAFSTVSLEFQYTQYQHGEITPDIIEFEKDQLRRNLAEIRRCSGREFRTVRFLDIGCGSGAGVKAADELGWAATGIDIDQELISKGRRQLSVDLRCISLLECDLPNESFDFIRLRDVIEHLPNPYEVMVKTKGLLSPGGMLLVSTPNEGGLPSRLRMLCGVPKKTVATVAPPHHLHGLCPDTLQRLLDRTGFRVYSVKSTTPIDPAYVTSRNMQAAQHTGRSLFWQVGKMLGMGSMLIGWAGK